MTVVELTAHSGNAEPVPDRVRVMVDWQPATRTLGLQYRLLGGVERIRLPAPVPAGRVDGLWHRSCCEAFIAHARGGDYCEFNFSPSGAWAAYRFAARRQGMRPLAGTEPPAIRLERSPDEVLVEVRFDPGPVACPPGSDIALGLAAVIEDREGRHSFWALRHGSSRPDFHDPSSFLLHLDAAGIRPAQEPAP
jgi:hypothetical protein